MSAEHVSGADELTVSVVGGASIRCEPDEAFVSITLTALDPSPGPALADVATRTEALVALLDELGIAREDRSTAGITVAEEFEYKNEGQQSRGHRASATISVRVTDTGLIGRMLMRSTGELDARVAGPRWRVSTDNPVWLEAATRAAGNAREKAAAYAAGVDARLGRLVSMSEFDEHGDGVILLSASTAHRRDMHVDPGEMEVTAAVRATFALSLVSPN